MKYTEEIQAEVVISVRMAGGAIVARASAVCEYQPGRTASAEVKLPEATEKELRSVLTAVLPAIEAELGKKLAHSRHEAARVSAAMGELPAKGPAKAAATKGRK